MESWLVRFCSWLQELSSICTRWIHSRKLQRKVQRCVHRYTKDTVEWRANDQNMMTTHGRGFLPSLPQPAVFCFSFLFPSSQMNQVGSRALNQDKTRWLHGAGLDTQSLLFSTMTFKGVFLGNTALTYLSDVGCCRYWARRWSRRLSDNVRKAGEKSKKWSRRTSGLFRSGPLISNEKCIFVFSCTRQVSHGKEKKERKAYALL